MQNCIYCVLTDKYWCSCMFFVLSINEKYGNERISCGIIPQIVKEVNKCEQLSLVE